MARNTEGLSTSFIKSCSWGSLSILNQRQCKGVFEYWHNRDKRSEIKYQPEYESRLDRWVAQSPPQVHVFVAAVTL